MPQFYKQSLNNLSSCDDRLFKLFTEVVKHFDCSVLCGHRNEYDQNKAYNDGNSQLQWPDSKHNLYPSKAVDVSPYPINWKDTHRFYLFGGFVLGLAKSMNINIRWGGDWNQDTQIKDNSFNDLVHFELVD